MKTKVYINASIYIDISNLSSKFLSKLKYLYTYRVKNKHSKKIDEIKYYIINKNLMRVPRGSVLALQECFKLNNINVEWISNVVSFEQEKQKYADFNVKLRKYQIDCINTMITKVQGVVQMPCGAGKTTSGTVALLVLNQPSLVLVHTKEILNQWVETIERIGFIRVRKITSGSFCDFKNLNKNEICVAMIQTLNSKLKKSKTKNKVIKFLDSVGAVLTDEAHHVPAVQWGSIIKHLKARYRWGLTATPDRADGLGFVLNLYIGTNIYHVTTKYLIENNYLQKPTIIPVRTGYTPKSLDYTLNNNRSILNFAKAVNTLSKDRTRNNMIIELGKEAVNESRQVLILVSRVKNANTLSFKLNKFSGIKSSPLTGETPKFIREEILSQFKTTETNIIVATQLADEGLDLPNIDCIISASPAKHHSRVLQRVGRALRLGGKPPLVFDFVDEKEFYSQYLSRKRAYCSEYGTEVLKSEIPYKKAKNCLL